MPFFKAFKDGYSGANEKYISENKIYKVIDFDFTNDGLEFAILDNFGEEIWFTDGDQCEFSYKNYFNKVKILNLE
jgi:hypothetical protein